MYDIGERDLRAGTALKLAAVLTFRHAAAFGAIALLVTVPTTWIIHVLGAEIVAAYGILDPSASTLSRRPAWHGTALLIGIGLGATVIQAIAFGAVAHGTIQSLGNRQVRILDCCARALKSAITIMGIMAIFLVALLLAAIVGGLPGFLLTADGSRFLGPAVLFAGGILACSFVYTSLWMAIPAAVTEGDDVSYSLGRSTRLTKGSRMTLFGLILATAGLRFGIQWLGSLALEAKVITAYSLEDFLLGLAAVTIFLVWEAVVAAVVYVILRARQERWRPGDDTTSLQ